MFDEEVVSLALIDDAPRPEVRNISSHFYAGVDFGKLHDPTAIVITEVNDIALTGRNYVTWAFKKLREWTVRHIERIPLHTAYPDVVSQLKTLVTMPQYKGRITLVIDATGLGVPLADFLRQAGLDCKIEDITITPDRKRDLITGLQVMFDMRDLRIPKGLPELGPLLHELSCMRTQESRTGTTQFAASTGEHDDLAIALALSCWPARPHVPTIGEKGDRLL